MASKKDRCAPPPVLEINNQIPVCFHKVVVAGDDIENPPKLGQYRNVILKYEGNGHVYIYSSDGIPTLVVGDDGTIDYEKLENKPLINGHELVGDSSLDDIGVNKAILNALKDYVKSNDLAKVATTGSYKDLSDTPTKVSEFENDAGYLTSVPTATTDTLGVVKVGDGLNITDGTLSVSEDVGALVFVDLTIASMTTYGDGYAITATPSKTFTEVKELFEAGKDIRYRLVVTQGAGAVFAGTYELAPLSLHSDFIYAAFTGQSNGTMTAAFMGHFIEGSTPQVSLLITSMAYALRLADVATSGSYNDLADKPTIGDATLTVQKNGATVGSFKANATTNSTIDITVPTTAVDVKALPDTTKYGASLTMSLNQTDYKITTTLKDQNGNTLGTAQTIDLPLESVVVGGEYDADTKSIILTLQNGNTIDVPVGDLIAGLQTEITDTNKLSADLVDDTSATHKFATSTQLTKIDELANIKTIGTGLSLADGVLNAAVSSLDWDNIANKPTDVSYWTNDAGYITSAALPTKTSDLENDSGFITSAAVPTKVSQLANDSNYITASANNLTNYYKKTETYTQSEVKGLLDALAIPTKTSELENDSGFLTSLPVASATTLGGVKVGNGLAISDGVLSATGISVGTITTAEIDTILGGI